MSILGKRKGRPVSRVQLEQILKKFQVFLKRELQLSYDVPVVLIDDADFAKQISAFGMITKDNAIHLSIINRHPVDIMRTLAHEFIHYKQYMDTGKHSMSPHAGSLTENQANAKAGEIVRKYGKMHSELFDLMSVR